MAKWLTFTLILLSSLSLEAQESVAPVSETSASAPSKRFSTALEYQVHSLPLKGSQLLGPNLAFKINRSNSVGTRLLMAPGQYDERRVSVFWRLSYATRTLHWIVEPHYSYLWKEGGESQFSTTGLSGGFRYSIREDIAAGLMLGIERSGPVFPLGPIWDRPSMMLFTQFDF